MKYKNLSSQTIPVKIKGEWVNVNPGDVIDSPVKIHDSLFELVAEKPKKEVKKPIFINDKVEDKKEEKKDNPLDLNNDGVVDKKDSSIAGKVLSHAKKVKKEIQKQIKKK